MRCDEVTREISASLGQAVDPRIAEHVAACASCATWAEQCAQFDQVWMATRAAAGPGDFERLWARVQMSTAEAAREKRANAVLPFTAAAHNFWRWAASGAAVAAALFLGWVGLSRLTAPEQNSARVAPPAIAKPVLAKLEADFGTTLRFQIEGSRSADVQLQPLVENAENDNVAAEFDLFNFMESQSTL